jgi:peptidoglycan hydrolase CwlO-like protein
MKLLIAITMMFLIVSCAAEENEINQAKETNMAIYEDKKIFSNVDPEKGSLEERIKILEEEVSYLRSQVRGINAPNYNYGSVDNKIQQAMDNHRRSSHSNYP